MRSVIRLLATAIVTTIAASLLSVAPANAASTTFEIDCTSSGYTCIPDALGYTGQSTWGSYVGARHNCTSFASWVLARTGMAQPWAPMGDGSAWDNNAARAGYTVNKIPAVGAVAQWDSGSSYASGGHVAIVSKIEGDVITILEDNFSSKVTRRVRIGAGSIKWPTNFIHVNDAGVAKVLGVTPTTPIAGDFDGDGTADILHYRPGAGADELWSFSGEAGQYQSTPLTINGTYRPFVGDFDDSGTTDIFWYGPGGGADSIWSYKTDGTFTSKPFTINGTYTPIAGDFDDSGTTDILWYGPGAGADSIWFNQPDGTFTSKPLAINGTYTPVAGDFDDSGTSDILWYGPGAGADSIWFNRPDGTFTSKPLAINGTYTPIAGDFDLSGTSDIFWYGPGAGADSMWAFAANGTFASTSHVMTARATPVVGNFAGDDSADIIWQSAGQTNPLMWLGSATDDPYLVSSASPTA